MKNKNLLIVILLLIIVGGASFFGGMKYQQSKSKFTVGQFQGGRYFGDGQGRMMVNGNGSRNGNTFRPVAGEIISMDDKTITVKMNDGSSKIVVLSDKTVYNKTSSGSLSDLKVGDNISIFGNTNTDGSVTAQNIQIGAIFRGMGNIPTPAQ